METRSSYVLVGSVVLAFTVLLFAVVLWLARFSGEAKVEYDILFNTSISGLATGSAVVFNGVPVGQVQKIALVPNSPQLVRVRIAIDPDTPILKGTTAGLEGVGFTGVNQISIIGTMGGQPPIVENGPFGRPLIPSRKGALGQLLASAPELLNNISALAGNLNKVLNPENRASIQHILAHVDSLSKALADRGPEIAETLVETKKTLQAAAGAANQLKSTLGKADGLMDGQLKTLLTDLDVTVKRASVTLGKVDGIVDAAKPGIDGLTTKTLPEVGQLVSDLRDVTQSLGAISQKLDEDPAGALLGGRKLPSYPAVKKGKK